MIWDIIFVLTFVVAGLNTLKMVSIMIGNILSLPGLLALEKTSPEKWYIFYPCYFYQAWFWLNYFEIIGITPDSIIG